MNNALDITLCSGVDSIAQPTTFGGIEGSLNLEKSVSLSQKETHLSKIFFTKAPFVFLFDFSKFQVIVPCMILWEALIVSELPVVALNLWDIPRRGTICLLPVPFHSISRIYRKLP